MVSFPKQQFCNLQHCFDFLCSKRFHKLCHSDNVLTMLEDLHLRSGGTAFIEFHYCAFRFNYGHVNQYNNVY